MRAHTAYNVPLAAKLQTAQFLGFHRVSGGRADCRQFRVVNMGVRHLKPDGINRRRIEIALPYR
jgi:hypothetical protein